MLATLRNRNFALLWSGGLISLMGDWVLNVGLPIYVFLLTRSVLILSITVLLNALPNILLGSVAGVFVDRWDRKRTIIITNLLLGLCALIGTIAAGFLTDHLGLITVLNVQAAGYVCAGLLALSLLPRESRATAIQAERSVAEVAAPQSEDGESAVQG